MDICPIIEVLCYNTSSVCVRRKSTTIHPLIKVTYPLIKVSHRLQQVPTAVMRVGEHNGAWTAVHTCEQ